MIPTTSTVDYEIRPYAGGNICFFADFSQFSLTVRGVSFLDHEENLIRMNLREPITIQVGDRRKYFDCILENNSRVKLSSMGTFYRYENFVN
jgi:hypothetical protein